MGPKSVSGSEVARRHAALLLEALCGLRTTVSASEAMGVALVRYYVLEARALQAMVTALEPRPRGRQPSPDARLLQLEAENKRLVREALRATSLYRVSQRALGVGEPKTTKPNGKRRRRPKKRFRGQVVVSTLTEAAKATAAVGAHDDRQT